MDNTEYIESYFKGANSDLQKRQFEEKIMQDESFAEEVAFYISANGVVWQQLQEEKKQRFGELYKEGRVISLRKPVKTLWRYMAAASVAAVIVLSWFLLGDKTSPRELADKYVKENWQILPVTMGTQDSLQTGLDLFNSGKLTDALSIFEKLAKDHPESRDAQKFAGIVSERMQNFDKALSYFSQLENDTALYSNPGKFYKAITLLERNKSGDKAAAKLLLQQVIEKDLEGKNEAVQWIKKL